MTLSEKQSPHGQGHIHIRFEVAPKPRFFNDVVFGMIWGAVGTLVTIGILIQL